MKKLNEREIAILEKYDFNVNNVEELETWTNGGVNMLVLYQEHHNSVLEAFEQALHNFDIDEEIMLYRQGQAYCNEFIIRESLEDYKERLENIVDDFKQLINDEIVECNKVDRLDLLDDALFTVIQGLNEELNLGLDIEHADHTSLVIDARQALIDTIKYSGSN